MITDVEGGDDVVQMGDVFGMISDNVLEADVGESCYIMFHVIIWYSHNNFHRCQLKLVSV